MSSNHDNQNDIGLSSQMENTNIETRKDDQENLAAYRILSFRTKAPDAYKGFVYSGWLESLRYGNDMFKLIDSESYYKAYSTYITNILKRPTSRLRIAVLTDDEDVALGWSVDEGDVLHYIYVPKDYRNKGTGLCSSLIPPGIKTFSHLTTPWMQIWQKKYPSLKFNPFL